MPHIFYLEEADDCLPDFAGAYRPRRHRSIRGALVRIEAIQFIRRPGCADAPTDFATIAFRSAVQDSTAVQADVKSGQPVELERRET
jgi:hypothetical protein